RAFLTGPLFRPTAGAVSSGACCRTINHHARGRRLMRIAYVCADPGVPVFGRKGCSVHVQEMLRALQGRGALVDVFAARVDEAPPFGLESLQVHRLTPVGVVGSMKPWHGLEVLVEAFARLHGRGRDARLLLVGDGPARAAVCAELSARGLTGVVHCTGAVAPHEVPGLVTSADVAVAPY